MIYHPGNVDLPAAVFDVDLHAELNLVQQVDISTGEVECAFQPVRVRQGTDEVDTFKIRFQSIYPIFGGGDRPCLFHCYGRRA